MTSDERERIIDTVPVEDVDAAVRALVGTLADGELDEELTQVLAVRAGDPLGVWEQLTSARDRWRREHSLAPAPMPFALGE